MAAKRTTRRSKGDGAYWFDKATKTHRIRITIDGKKYTVSDPERSGAETKLRALKAELAKGLDRPGGAQTLRTFLLYWLDTVIKSSGAKTSTHHNYEKRITIYITPNLGDYRLKDLTTPLIRAWVNAMRDAYALSSAKQALAILDRALDVAVEDKLIEYNPAKAVKPPKADANETTITDDEETGRTLSADQEAALLSEVRRTDRHFERSEAARSEGIYPLYVLALRLGLRRGELLGLRWKDIDFDARVLRVRQQVIVMDGVHKVTTPKTKKARRDLPLADDLVTMLREHKLKLGALGATYVFPGKDGKHRKPRALNMHFARACERISLSGFVFHDLRATAITRWRMAGVDLEVAAALAGHGTIQVTGEIYSDATMDRKRKALENM